MRLKSRNPRICNAYKDNKASTMLALLREWRAGDLDIIHPNGAMH